MSNRTSNVVRYTVRDTLRSGTVRYVGGAGGLPGIPINALVDRNGEPILDANGNYILVGHDGTPDPLLTDLVAWYEFDGDGTDSHTSGVDLVASGSVSYPDSPFGKAAYSPSFSSAKLYNNSAGALNSFSADQPYWTVFGRMRVIQPVYSGDYQLLIYDAAGNYMFRLWVNGGQPLWAHRETGDFPVSYFGGSTPTVDDNWFTFFYYSAPYLSIARAYFVVNGVQCDQETWRSGNYNPIGRIDVLTDGTSQNGTYFDQLAIWKRTLSSAERARVAAGMTYPA